MGVDGTSDVEKFKTIQNNGRNKIAIIVFVKLN